MIEIKDLLTRYNNSLISSEFQKEAIQKGVASVIGVDIKTEDIEIKNNIIYLNLKPIYKNEIFIKKEKIQSFLDNVLGEKSPGDIR
jgi:hypothetical protein